MAAIPPLTREQFRLAGSIVDPARNSITVGSREDTLEPRVMDVLCALASKPGEVRLRHEILDHVWGSSAGTDDALSRAVSIIRRTYRQLGVKDEIIETAARRGYRLVPAVEVLPPSTKFAIGEPPSDVVPNVVVGPERKPRRTSKSALLVAAGTLAILTLFVAFQFRNNTATPDPVVQRMMPDTERPSIAVLPFRDFSSGQDQLWFAQGIADGLLNDLARTDGLRVASRTSAFSFSDDQTPVRDVAQALNVRHILEGSVQRSGDALRVTAQLIDTETDAHIWSDTYDRELTPNALFDVQDSIRREIVTQLVGRLDTRSASSIPTRSQLALEAFLKGRAAYQSRDRNGLDEAASELARAVDIDPEYARAHAELARVYRLQGQMGFVPSARADTLADISLERAVSLAPDEPDVLTAKAWVQDGRIAPSEVLPLFEAALAANPSDGEAYRGRARSLTQLGEYDRALADLETATQIDPRSVPAWTSLAFGYDRAGRIGERNAALLRLLELDPDHVAPLQILSSDAFGRGDVPRSHSIAKQAGEAMRWRLNYIYYETDLREHIVDPDPDLRADMAFADGDHDKALAIAYEPEATPTTRIRALYHADRLDDVIPVWVGSNIYAERYYPIFDDPEKLREAIKHDNAFTSIVMGLKDIGDPTWQMRSTQLVEAYGDLQGLSPSWDYSKAIALATHGDINGAMESARLYMARGIGKLVAEVDPGFKPLRDDPRWSEIVATNAARRAEHRAAVAAQLANPPEVWFSSDEITSELADQAGQPAPKR